MIKPGLLAAFVVSVSLGVSSVSWGQDAVPDIPVPVAKPAAAGAAPPPPQATPNGMDDDLSMNWAILGGLDKLTARVVTIETEVGRSTHFGQLEIIARSCRQRRPEAAIPESAAFLDIWDTKPGQPAQSVFRGWMFASSPALSAMEHPIYDVWVLSCKGAGR